MAISENTSENSSMSRRTFVKNVGLVSAAAIVASALPGFAADDPVKPQFIQEPLPYPVNALEPWLSARTIDIHYNKHHRMYVDGLNKRLAFLKLTYPTLEAAILDKKDGINLGEDIYTMAVLSWNHDFYWKSMAPNGGVLSNEKFKKAMIADFGSIDAFNQKFLGEAMKIGVGWVWLVRDGAKLDVVRTEYHESPLLKNLVPLVACDVWEHAYYLDYQNRRDDYVKDWLAHLVNWDFAANNYVG